MLEVRSYPQEDTYGPNSGCYWVAECTLEDGRSFTARSRHGAANELARQLVEAGVPDDAMQTYERGLKALRYRSFHEAAKWTYTEGNKTLRRVPYIPPDEIAAAFQRQPQSGGVSLPDVSEASPASDPQKMPSLHLTRPAA